MRRFLALVLLFCAVAPLMAQDGIYADFTTSMGSFSCKLHYDRAPKTVANFIALTTGERGWLDLNTGAAKRTPFFDSLTFHRVISGFVIQGGSRNGLGTDGPGYTFQDEFNSTLRHDKAGILSMANSGLNSNGSQFFITLAATPHLDDVHSVFGEVTSGLSVVQAIGNVPVGANDKPVTPVVMQNVVIRRVGTAAQAFDISAQGLPSVGGAGPNFVRSGASSLLQFPKSLYSEYTLFDSANLQTWNGSRIALYVTPPPNNDLDVSSSAVGPAHFYRVAEVAYPGPIYTPPSVAGNTLQLNFTVGISGTLVLAFNNSGGGTSSYMGGTITSYEWAQEAYRGQLLLYTTTLVPFSLNHVFTSPTGGFFKGTAFLNTGEQLTVGGTFTRTVTPSAAIASLSATTSTESVQSVRTTKTRTRTTKAVASRSKRSR